MALEDIQRHLAWKLQGIPQDGDLLGAAGVTGSPGLVLEADGRRRGPLRPTIHDLLDAVDELLA